MKLKQVIIFLIVSILQISLIELWAQEYIISSNGIQHKNSEVDVPELLIIKSNQNKIIVNSDQYILSWRKLKIPPYRTGFPYGTDSMCVWFQPLGACSLKSVRIYPITFDGTMVLDIWGSNYKGHIVTRDSIGYIGDWDNLGWWPGKVLRVSPLADHIWGSLTFTITRSQEPYWREIYPDSSRMVYIGDRSFIVGIYCRQKNNVDGTWGIEGEETVPSELLTSRKQELQHFVD